ncbi:MAG: glutamyl-tRNA reductase [Acidobacteria bacterium]|nr:glutamyl-tRNA reductase [Acidobacteriota bacterium]
MVNYVVVGLNHRTAELDFRQMASFDADKLPIGLNQLSASPGILEAMILSTCNRVEILSNVENTVEGIPAIETFLSEFSRIPLDQIQPKLYRHTETRAVHHVFRVASSLDSMILGEPQILGQMKSCYTTAVEAKTVGAYLNILLQAAFRAAKHVRSETSIGEYPVSVSSAAVELVRKIFGDLRKKKVLIVGAGEMGEATIRYLADIGVNGIYVANRSPEAAHNLAQSYEGVPVPFNELIDWIARMDIVFTSTGAAEILVNRRMMQDIMHARKNETIAFIDISVPRNIDPDVGEIDNVFCYDIDDLQAVVEANLQERQKAAAEAEKIVDMEVSTFCSKLKSFEVAPVVTQVQGHIKEICATELQRCLRKIGPQEPRQIQELESMIARIAGKIAHPLVMQLRGGQDSIDKAAYVDMIKQIFKLQKDSD